MIFLRERERCSSNFFRCLHTLTTYTYSSVFYEMRIYGISPYIFFLTHPHCLLHLHLFFLFFSYPSLPPYWLKSKESYRKLKYFYNLCGENERELLDEVVVAVVVVVIAVTEYIALPPYTAVKVKEMNKFCKVMITCGKLILFLSLSFL